MIEVCAASEKGFLAALNEGYKDYPIPISFQASTLRWMVESQAIDLQHSGVLRADGDIAGVFLVAQRDERLRLAALAVAPRHRGRGIAQFAVSRVSAIAAGRRCSQVSLEVFASNLTAKRVYERAGFHTTRPLYGFAREPDIETQEPSQVTRVMSTEQALAYIGGLSSEGQAWQLEPRSFLRLPSGSLVRSLEDKALVVFSEPGARAESVVRFFHVQPGSRRNGYGLSLLRDIRSEFPGTRWVLPQLVPDGPVRGLLEADGWARAPLIQLEMVLRL